MKHYRHYSRGFFWRLAPSGEWLRLCFHCVSNMHRGCCAFLFALADHSFTLTRGCQMVRPVLQPYWLSIYTQSTHVTDGWTDGQTEFRWLWHVTAVASVARKMLHKCYSFVLRIASPKIWKSDCYTLSYLHKNVHRFTCTFWRLAAMK